MTASRRTLVGFSPVSSRSVFFALTRMDFTCVLDHKKPEDISLVFLAPGVCEGWNCLYKWFSESCKPSIWPLSNGPVLVFWNQQHCVCVVIRFTHSYSNAGWEHIPLQCSTGFELATSESWLCSVELLWLTDVVDNTAGWWRVACCHANTADSFDIMGLLYWFKGAPLFVTARI